MKKKNILALACVFLMMIGILSGCGGGEEAAYPAEDISCLVPYAAGGGTDNIARAVAANIDLPVSIACSVMTGAGGYTGSQEFSTQPGDGYHIMS